MEALELRLGPVPPGLREAILVERDRARLDRLFALSITSADFESFAAGL